MTALSLDLTWATGDTTGNYITASTGTTYLLLVYNAHATVAKTITISSVVDSPFNRTGDITAYSVAAQGYSHFYFQASAGWKDGSNHITITPQSTDIKFLVVSF